MKVYLKVLTLIRFLSFIGAVHCFALGNDALASDLYSMEQMDDSAALKNHYTHFGSISGYHPLFSPICFHAKPLFLNFPPSVRPIFSVYTHNVDASFFKLNQEKPDEHKTLYQHTNRSDPDPLSDVDDADFKRASQEIQRIFASSRSSCGQHHMSSNMGTEKHLWEFTNNFWEFFQ
jgi:hypothetical protein